MNRFERILIWISSALVVLSGAGLAWAKYLVVSHDPFAAVGHPWQPWFLKLHVLSAPLMVFALGVVSTRHVLTRWKSGARNGRRTGLWVGVMVVPMVASGYLIQTVTWDSWLDGLVAIHLVTGFGYLAGITGHQIAALLRRPVSGKARVEPTLPLPGTTPEN